MGVAGVVRVIGFAHQNLVPGIGDGGDREGGGGIPGAQPGAAGDDNLADRRMHHQPTPTTMPARPPQALPPWATVVRMERVAYWEPPPQDLEHLVNLP